MSSVFELFVRMYAYNKSVLNDISVRVYVYLILLMFRWAIFLV